LLGIELTDVVDQKTYIQFTNLCLNHSSVRLVKFGIIADNILDLHPVLLVVNFLLHVLEFFLRATDNHHIHASLGQFKRVSLSDSVCGSRHNSPFSEFGHVLGRAEKRLVGGNGNLRRRELLFVCLFVCLFEV
jgi:hypothetical protein